jgi:hypothetical protein
VAVSYNMLFIYFYTRFPAIFFFFFSEGKPNSIFKKKKKKKKLIVCVACLLTVVTGKAEKMRSKSNTYSCFFFQNLRRNNNFLLNLFIDLKTIELEKKKKKKDSYECERPRGRLSKCRIYMYSNGQKIAEIVMILYGTIDMHYIYTYTY